MALSCGFYNSSNGDRKYNSVDFSRIFDGIITDGIYATYEKAMVVKASEKAGEVIIQPGRAWFNHSWSYNDADYVMKAPAPEVLLDRIDALVLDVNSEMATRDNTFKWVTGTPASKPERPSLIRSVTHNQYPLCYVRRYAETTMIYAKDITNTVGTSECPFVTGVLEGINIDVLLAQWDDEFHTWENATKASFEGWMVNQQAVYTRWWDALKTQMSGDVADVEKWVQKIRGIIDSEAATHLQAEIDELNKWVPNGSYLRIVTKEQELFSRAVTISDLAGHSQTENFDAKGVAIFKSFPYVGTLNIASSNGARTAVQTITVPYFTRMENVQLAFWSATVNIEADIEMAGYTVTVKDSNDATVTTVVLNANAEGIFRAQAPDTYKFQVTYGGETMEVSLAVTEETTYSVSINAGFNWRRWVTLGGLNPSSYSSLKDVFKDKAAVRRLMTIHASADYLIKGVEKKLSVIDDFCANDTAMKWIGLRDYVCDGLTAISGVVAKFLASQYWERYLKDHVPTMTSNTAPYGEVSADSIYGSAYAYCAFDADLSNAWISSNSAFPHYLVYKSTNPVCVKHIKFKAGGGSAGVRVKDYIIQGSNDGNGWENIYSGVGLNSEAEQEVTINDNNEYYLYHRFYIVSSYDTSANIGALGTLQFYGRSLNVSVPVMTSNTAPYGECLVTNDSGATSAYKAFDNDSSTNWGSDVSTNAFVGYDFGRNVCIKQFKILPRYLTNLRLKNFKIEVSEDKSTWEEVYSGLIPSASQSEWFYGIVTDANLKSGRYCRLLGVDTYGGNVGLLNLQFYGLDYSEREFEPNTNKKWLYDHGLELEPMTAYRGNVVKGNDSIKLTYNQIAASCGVTMDLTPYSLVRAKVTEFTDVYNYIMVTNAGITQAIAQNQITSNSAPNNVSLDISNVNSELPLMAQSQQVNGCSQELTELWLEP